MSEQTKTAVKQGGMNTKVRYITVTAMLSAVAFVLMYLEIAIPIMPSFIKFDFSDLPALLGSFALECSVWGIDLSDQERSPSGIFKQYVCWRTFQFYSRSRVCGNCR